MEMNPTKLVRIELGLNNIHGKFLKRLNRFTVLADIGGETSEAFMPNPGRLLELLRPNAPLILRRKNSGKTPLELLAIRDTEMIVPIDSRLPNKLLHIALAHHALPPFSYYSHVRAEYSYGSSRFDFMLSDSNDQCLVEVKSCTLVRDSVALFPDAPSQRGSRHVQGLVEALSRGFRACIVFVIQRSDAHIMKPYWSNDPKFARALSDASEKGVEVYAWKVKPVDESLSVILGEQIPVDTSTQNLDP